MRLVAPAIALTLLLSACGADTDHNEADIEFARQMVPHQRQALQMARLVDGADAGGQVEKLAAEIEKAQEPTVRTMSRWLDEWGADTSTSTTANGMLSGSQVRDLHDVKGSQFDHLWLTLMIEKHEGAVTLAEREMRYGEYSDAIDLAHDITRSQATEIDHMKELLDD